MPDGPQEKREQVDSVDRDGVVQDSSPDEVTVNTLFGSTSKNNRCVDDSQIIIHRRITSQAMVMPAMQIRQPNIPRRGPAAKWKTNHRT
jgi:hypothetical protein